MNLCDRSYARNMACRNGAACWQLPEVMPPLHDVVVHAASTLGIDTMKPSSEDRLSSIESQISDVSLSIRQVRWAPYEVLLLVFI